LNKLRHSLSVESLLWAMSLFCAFIGAFLLVAPHHFQSPPFRVLLPYSLAWGTLSLASGVALLAVAVVRPRRWVCLGVHAVAAVTLLALAVSFGMVKALTGMFTYTILGLGMLLAGLLPRDRPGSAPRGDLFALLMGIAATVSGALVLLLPGLFQNPFYGPFRSYIQVVAPALLLTAPLLAWAQLAPELERRRLWTIHALTGMTYFSFGALISIPSRVWTGVVLYCGGGLLIAFLPGLRRGLAALDTSALRTRLALALAIATSLALISATAVVTAQEERLAEDQVRRIQGIEARSIAQNVSDYVEMNSARVSAVATLAGRTGEQAVLLASARRSIPDVAAFRWITPKGRVAAAAGNAPIPPRLLAEAAREIRREDQARRRWVRFVPGKRPLLLVAVPIHDQGTLAGVLVAAWDSKALEGRIGRPESRVSLADGQGTLIAVRSAIPAGVDDLPGLPPGWDRAVSTRPNVRQQRGVAFAAAPGLGWVVAMETPRSVALAGVRQGRDLAFGLLLLVIPLAVLIGIVAARRIARPLGQLATAVDALTAGDLAAPVATGAGITEVARLSAAFQEMRDRLAERTRESERLAAELRARAEALAETDRRKDEFLAMLAHELRNPLGAIANASYLLETLGTEHPQKARAVEIIRRQIQHLVVMVDDLLDVSRITRGKVELRREPLDFAEIVRQSVETAHPLAESKELRLSLELAPGPMPLNGDATRLEQVLSNLLRNAVKFTDPGGNIGVSARRDGDCAVVRVKDDGIGMAPDLLPRIFDLFAQGEQALDRSGAGLGIGLTLVRSLVEMHGGTVEARSEGLGKGSEFEVRLPLEPAAVLVPAH
jgi:signal transduction histidine kinase